MVIVLFLVTVVPVMADPSSAILLRRGNLEAQTDSPAKSSRYTVKPKKKKEKPESSPTFEEPLVQDQSESLTLEKLSDVEQKASDPPLQDTPTTSLITIPPNAKKREEKQSLYEDVEDLVFGGDFYSLMEYKMSLQESDVRKNRIEVYLSPALIYVDSTSSMRFHRYTHFSPGIGVASNLWITPYFGFFASYLTSSQGSFKQISQSDITYDFKDLDYGLQFRRFFSKANLAPSLSFQVRFKDQQFKIDQTATERVGFTFKGLGLGLRANLPTSPRYQQTYQLDWVPNATYDEERALLELSTGNSPKSTQIGIGIGGEYLFDRKSVVFWQLMQIYSRTNFSGQSNTDDPKTGSKPENVKIDHSRVQVIFGFKWGN